VPCNGDPAARVLYQEVPGGSDGVGTKWLSLDGSPILWSLSEDCEVMAYDTRLAPQHDWSNGMLTTITPAEAEDVLARHGVVDAFRDARRGTPPKEGWGNRIVIDGVVTYRSRFDERGAEAQRAGREAIAELIATGTRYEPSAYWVTTIEGIRPDPDTAALIVPDWGASGSPQAYRSVGARVDVAAEPWFVDVRTQVQATGVDDISRVVLMDTWPEWGLAIRPIWPEWIEQNGTVVLP